MNTQNEIKKEIWIGLAHVKPKQGNDALQGAKGAFAPILSMATDVNSFISTATSFLNAHGFEVIEMEDVQIFEERCRDADVDEELMTLAQNLSETDPVQIDIFQSYIDE